MKNTQLTHDTTSFTHQKFPIVLICDGVQSPANIGSLFRICEALGVLKIIFGNAQINFSSSRLLRTARNTQKTVPFNTSEKLTFEIDQLKEEGYRIIALEITKNSLPIEKFSTTNGEKIALIIGNEQEGISEEILEKASTSFHIEMYGENSSMNVVQAASIGLHSIINKIKLSL